MILITKQKLDFLKKTSTSTKTNNWGAEFVINSENGELINQIEGNQFRGRFATNYFDNKVLLHTFKTIDLLTGEVSENQVIRRIFLGISI